MPEPGGKNPEIVEISLPDPWHLYLLKTSNVPLIHQELSAVRTVVSAIQRAATVEWKLRAHTFLQTWKIAVEGNPALYEANLGKWLPTIGLGVWPNRNPPRRLTQSSAMDAAAAMFSGEEPELSTYYLVYISGGETAAEHAAETMLGRGMLQQLFTAKSFSDLQEQGKKVFLDKIEEQAYKRSRYYTPLLESATFAAATSEQIGEWMCGADLYLRESAEDKGLLILSRRDLRSILEPLSYFRPASSDQPV